LLLKQLQIYDASTADRLHAHDPRTTPLLRRYIANAPIGRRRLNQLTPADVQAWVNDLTTRISSQTVRNCHARLHKALAVAVKQHYLARNPAEGIELPSVRSRPIQPLDFDQATALLDAVEGHRWAALYRLAINLGLAEGEVIADAGARHARCVGQDTKYRLLSRASGNPATEIRHMAGFGEILQVPCTRKVGSKLGQAKLLVQPATHFQYGRPINRSDTGRR
jgi:hypothetical protein